VKLELDEVAIRVLAALWDLFWAGLVTATEWLMGHLNLSTFQINALATMLAAGLGEFLLTVWVRFVVNRRTIGIDTT